MSRAPRALSLLLCLATTGHCRSPSPECFWPSPCAIGFASTRRTHFPSFPFLYPSETNHHSHLLLLPEQALAAAVPFSSLTLSTGNHPPGVRVAREHVLPPTSQSSIHRRAGAPPLPSLCLFVEKERRSRKEEEEEERKRKSLTVYFGWQPVIFQGSDNQVAYLGFIHVGARQVIIPLL
uniref:Uncharacterized protein n=1 Tax=Oryza glumipatula TaxID=40148 RepID=A0A0D9ZU41_9ORYZ